MSLTHLLYLHGFRSSPQSFKARRVHAWLAEHAPEVHFFFRAEFVDELRVLTVPAITRPERYFAVIAKGDEVLDWREMAARYAGARIRLLEGSDHALSAFDEDLPHVLRFLNLE